MNNARPHSASTPVRSLRVSVRHALPVAAMLAAASTVAQPKNETQESLSRRYPYDPVCPWGRIGNGRGMIVRCLTQPEAARLTQEAPGGRPVTGSEPTAQDPGSTEGGPEDLEVSVGPIVADQGELSVRKVAQPKDRYARCVVDHGGLTDRSGEVHVRFLVRLQGIAEGVSVQKRVNLSSEAATCIAEIVDRRRVGVPEAPLVGATVVVKFEKVSK